MRFTTMRVSKRTRVMIEDFSVYVMAANGAKNFGEVVLDASHHPKFSTIMAVMKRRNHKCAVVHVDTDEMIVQIPAHLRPHKHFFPPSNTAMFLHYGNFEEGDSTIMVAIPNMNQLED